MNFVKDLHIMHTADPPARFYMRDQRAAKYRPQCSILQDIMLIQFIFDSKHLKISLTTSEAQREREKGFGFICLMDFCVDLKKHIWLLQFYNKFRFQAKKY